MNEQSPWFLGAFIFAGVMPMLAPRPNKVRSKTRLSVLPISYFLREAAAEFAEAGAVERQPRPYHFALAEMNLARVEYYFARFLSAMEIRARGQEAFVELGSGE